MNKAELKQLLKPLIKECIKEVIFEDGVLSGVVSEVAKGLSPAPLVEAATTAPPAENNFDKLRQQSLAEQKKKLNNHRQQLMEAMGENAYNGVNLFEGLEPAPQEPKKGQTDLGHPGDAGVDISSILGNSSQVWKAIK